MPRHTPSATLHAYKTKCYRQHNAYRLLPEAARRAKKVRAQLDQDRLNHLLTHPCVDCGETDVIVLQFDHRPGTHKVCEVTKAASKRQLIEEMAKCDVRCANCHVRVTKQRGQLKRRWLGRAQASDLPTPAPQLLLDI